MSLSSKPPLLAARVEKPSNAEPEPVPAGDEMAVLAPGEDPGNGAEILDALGAETPRRAAADLEMRQFLDRARRLEIADKARVLGEFAIVPRMNCARDLFDRRLMRAD